MAQAWIVRAGPDDEYEQPALAHGVVAMGWRRLGDLTGHRSHRSINTLVDDEYAEFSAESRQAFGAQLYAFRCRMRPGDHVVLLRSNAPDLAIGTVTGDYAYRPDLPGPHVRAVRWARTRVSRAEVGADLLNAPALTSIYRVGREGAGDRLAAIMAAPRDGKQTGAAPPPRPDRRPASGETARENLRRNLEYAYSLAAGGQALQDLKVQAFDVTDVYRAAWVQAMGAFDHWVGQEIRERMLAAVERDPAARADAVFQLPDPLAGQVAAGRIGPAEAVQEHWQKTFGRTSFHQAKVIRNGLGKVAEVEQLWPRVAAVLTERAGAAQAYTADAVIERLQDVVYRRNKIAHEYDEDPERPPAKRPIDRAATTNAIGWMERLAEAIVVGLDGTPAVTA